MNNQEILTKAIEKAIAGGWDAQGLLEDASSWKVKKKLQWPQSTDKSEYELAMNYLMKSALDEEVELESYRTLGLDESIIFNHDFAKALWGDTEEYFVPLDADISDVTGYPQGRDQEAWVFHLQQMVIADDPIAYLGDNL